MEAELAPMPLVLMYHSVTTARPDPFRITVGPRRFDDQMRWLRRRRFRGTSVGELLRARRAGRRDDLVALTFDDGYADFVTEVMPVLDRYGFTATVFVVAGALGGHNSWDDPGPRKALMTAEDVQRAAEAGMEIGSHSLSHRPLPELDEPALADELRRSRSILGRLVGLDVSGFCYPYGRAGVREIDAVRAAGYDYACAVGMPALAGRHALPRTYVGDRDAAPRLFVKWTRHRLTSNWGTR
jgi:peptidoglycan/xylan/chitin deacetylase (PgdA/CDA1 family)